MTSRRPRLDIHILEFRCKSHVRRSAVTFVLLKMRLFDKSRDSSGQMIDQANCLNAASHNLVLTIGGEVSINTRESCMVPLPRLRLFDSLITTGLGIPVSFFDRSHTPSADEVIGQADYKLIVVGCDDVGH